MNGEWFFVGGLFSIVAVQLIVIGIWDIIDHRAIKKEKELEK